METPLIEFRNVTKRFGEKTVLHDVNLKIYENQITTIIGKSGTGKTVLLKHIIGLIKPDEGAILFRGKPVKGMKKAEWKEYKRRISYLFQHNALFDSMTVYENVALPLIQTTSLKKKEIEERVRRRISQTELTDAANRYPSELSGGMQKRAALARALIADPSIVLFDEPTTGQDPIRKNAILSMIAQYRRRFGFTAVLVSHDIPDVFFVSDRVVLLWEGTVGVEGTYEEVVRLSHPMIAEFLNSLEGLQNEVTGLMTKEAFRSCYTSMFAKDLAPATSAVLFTLEPDIAGTVLGPHLPQQLLEALGDYANHRFRSWGGFSALYSNKQILTILPHTNAEEAEQLMEKVGDELLKQVKATIETVLEDQADTVRGLAIVIKGGVTEVSSHDDIDHVVRRAESGGRTVSVYRRDHGGAGA